MDLPAAPGAAERLLLVGAETDLLRAVRGLTADQLRRLREDAERMQKEGKDEEQ